MRVAMYYSNKDVRLEQAERPVIERGEVLVRIEASGICGTDCLEWYRIHRVPLVLGHEVAGVIAEVAKGVKGYKVGDRVCVAHHVPCGKCRYCKRGHETVCDTLRKTNFYPGGFSEYVRVPDINVRLGMFKLPNSVTFEDATFIEPLACVIRGQRAAQVKKGDTVLVVGSGISGLLHIKLAKARGAKKIFATDLSDFRLSAARRYGAEEAFNAKDFSQAILAEANGGKLADVVILSAGALPAVEQGIRSVERGGTVLFFAASGKDDLLPVPINDIFWRSEVTLTSSYAGSPDDHREALRLIASKKIIVNDMITHRLRLCEAQKGFQLVSGATDSIKVIIEPQK